MFSKRSVEIPRLIMIRTHSNMTCHEYQGMFDIALFFDKKTKYGSPIKFTYIVDR